MSDDRITWHDRVRAMREREQYDPNKFDYLNEEERKIAKEQERLRVKSIQSDEFYEYSRTLHSMLTNDDVMLHVKWSIRETAEYFHVAEHTVRGWVKTGKIPAEHELTEMKGAKHPRWRWWIYVKDILELEDQYRAIERTYGMR